MEASTLMESTRVSVSLSNDKYYKEGPVAEDIHIDLLILGIIVLLSLIGNILVVVINVFCMRPQSLTIFILNLSLSDLLFTVGLVIMFYEQIWGLTLRDAVCKVVYCIFSAGFYSSIVFLVLMSVQRYMAVLHPPSGWKKGRCFTFVLICAWMVSILASLPVGLHTVAHPDSGSCTYGSSDISFITITYKYNIVFVCAFLVMSYCYIRILQTIFKSPTNQKLDWTITGLTFVLVAMFFICWTPFNIMIFLNTLSHDQIRLFTQDLEDFYYIGNICQLLAFTRCCLNPVVYGLFGVKLRTTVREVLQRRADFNSAQMMMGDSGSCVNLNNQVPELDVNPDFS